MRVTGKCVGKFVGRTLVVGVAREYVLCNELKLNLIYCLSAGMKFMTRVSVREREPRFEYVR